MGQRIAVGERRWQTGGGRSPLAAACRVPLSTLDHPERWQTGGVVSERLLPLRVRAAINVLNLSTPVGLLIAKIGGARITPGPRGLFFAEGYRWRFPVAGAFTVGNVITTRHRVDALTGVLPDVLKHEDAHAWQWCVLGPLFLPLYLSGAAWSWVRAGDPATKNLFERQAGLVSGGYVRPDAE